MATLGSILLLLLSGHTLVTSGAAAAGGPQPAPTLDPDRVASSGDVFSLQPPTGARCEEDGSGDGAPGPRSGADNWRWHGFIVEAGRDLSTLRFEPLGPGQDFDASDGAITAPLYLASTEPVIQQLPALKPEGLINPDELAGIVLDPSVYTLRNGDYQLGFACTDGGLEPRQWWSLAVTIDTGGSPFLVAAGAAGEPVAAPAVESSPSTVAEPGPPTTAAPGPSSAEVQGVQGPATELVAATSPAIDLEVLQSPRGISWAPLLAAQDASARLPVTGWAVLTAVFARVAYLLARPVRVLPPLLP
ncbi:MAG: hypothetical protein ACSLFP_06970 [Acidimicrobiales bacterium]